MFKQVKTNAIKCLYAGLFQHESRNEIDEKKLLLTGKVSVDEVKRLINKTRGFEYSASKHHAASVDVHIFKPEGWYIKFYFIEPEMMFISVHKS